MKELIPELKQVTIHNLHESTAQEVFDFIAVHLLTQRDKSVSDEWLCSYRGAGGLKCAAGCLFPDEDYRPEYEGKDWKMLVVRGDVPAFHADLISSLQDIHDKKEPAFWVDELTLFAGANGLSCEAFKHLI